MGAESWGGCHAGILKDFDLHQEQRADLGDETQPAVSQYAKGIIELVGDL